MHVPRRHVVVWVLTALVGGAVIGAATVGRGNPSPATVSVVSVAAYPISVTAGDYKLYDFVVDFPPGGVTPRHVHGGPVLVTVITGQLVLERTGGERMIKAGESFLEVAGDVHALANRGTVPARISAAELIPIGAAETTIVK